GGAAMILHILATSIGKLRKSPLSTAANVLALALGLACFVAAWGFASWLGMGDARHSLSDRTVVIGSSMVKGPLRGPAPAPAGPLLAEDVAELETVVRAFSEPGVAVSTGQSKALLDAVVAEPAFLQVFDFDFVAGSRDALATPGSVVLTEET